MLNVLAKQLEQLADISLFEFCDTTSGDLTFAIIRRDEAFEQSPYERRHHSQAAHAHPEFVTGDPEVLKEVDVAELRLQLDPIVNGRLGPLCRDAGGKG